jgi:alpha-amylase
MGDACRNVFALGTFSENHDLPRFASFTQDLALAGNMLAFDIMMDGIPVSKSFPHTTLPNKAVPP